MRVRGLLAIFALTCVTAAEQTPPIDDALNHLYNFDFQGAHQVLDILVAARPQDPLPSAFRASAYLFWELDRMGILESEFLIDDQRIAEQKKAVEPDPIIRTQFFKALDDAQSRAEAMLRTNPDDRNALFAVCIAQGI